MNPRRKAGARYFVVRLSAKDPERAEGFLVEIQILDSQGRGELVGYLREGQSQLEIEGQSVPRAVIEAAWRQPEGQGDYVDPAGNTTTPF